jgi:hypothetical protein
MKDPTVRLLTRLDKFEWRNVAGMRILYGEAGTRNADEVKRNKPYHFGVGATVCTGKTHINLTLVLPTGSVTDAERTLLLDIVSSLK